MITILVHVCFIYHLILITLTAAGIQSEALPLLTPTPPLHLQPSDLAALQRSPQGQKRFMFARDLQDWLYDTGRLLLVVLPGRVIGMKREGR